MSTPITTKKTTKLTIPHNIEHGVNIVGVLEQLEPERETRGRKIAIVSLRVSYAEYTNIEDGAPRFYMVRWGECVISFARLPKGHTGIDEARSA